MSDEKAAQIELDGASVNKKKLTDKQRKALMKLYRKGSVSAEYVEKFDIDKSSYDYIYASSRRSGLSVPESFYNALFVSTLNTFDKSKKKVSDELKNTYSHPKGWYENQFMTWKNNFWSFLLSFLQSIPLFLNSVRSLPGKTKGAYDRSAARMDNSFKLFVSFVRFLKRCLSFIIPACLGILLVIALHNSLDDTVAVDIFINGEYIGVVEDFDIISETKRDLERNIVSPVDDGINFDDKITYSLTSGKKHDYLTKSQVYSALYEVVKEEIVPAYGFYIDGTLVAVTKNKHALEVIKDEINEYFADMQSVFGYGNDIKIATSNNIVIEEGNFPTSVVVEENKVRELLGLAPVENSFTPDYSIYSVYYNNMVKPVMVEKSKRAVAQTIPGIVTLVSGSTEYEPNVDISADYTTSSQPSLVVLGYKIIKTKTVKESIPFGVEYVYTDKYLDGTLSVDKVGKEGTKNATYEIAYSDVDETQELERVLISEQIIKEPQNKVVLVGTRTPTDEEVRTLATGTFIIPYDNYLSADYGLRTITEFGTKDFHQAWDIPGPYGAKIVASDSGVVSNISRTSGYGLRIIVDHENGYKTLYAHLSDTTVNVGDRVAQGEQIAKMGSSGRVTGVHVHFEIIKDGVTVDPADYLGEVDVRY